MWFDRDRHFPVSLLKINRRLFFTGSSSSSSGFHTAGLSLEEIDKLFEIKYYGDKSMTYREAAETAKATLCAAETEHVEKIEY